MKVGKVPTVDDVARLAGVSNATVSRVINQAEHVSSKTKQRVTEAMRQLHFSPNKFARCLAGNRADGIGVVIPEFTDPYHGALLQAIEQVTREQDLQVMAASSHRLAEDERKAIRFLNERSYNVLILSSSALPASELADLASEGITCFQLGRKLPDLADRSLYLDHAYGGKQAVDHLLAKGHTRIAHVALPNCFGVDTASVDRSQGYRQALEDAGVLYDDALVIHAESFDEAGGYHATRSLLHRKVPFTALFLYTDRMAMGAYQALSHHGLRIPDDVSVVGYDGLAFTAFMQPALTTVRQPIEEMGRLAAQLAIEQLHGVPRQGAIAPFEPELVIRDSGGGIMSP